MTLTVGSLFAGIGGNDLGLERAGMRTLWQVELDPWCRRVLAKHWPDVERFEDVREVGAHNLSPVDLIAGGFPCQDISIAGRAAGIGGARSGLWGEFARIVRELRPRYVLVENSPVLTSRGMDVVLGDLAASGYDAEWDCLPAAAFGAPFVRDRVFVVATPCGLDTLPVLRELSLHDSRNARARLRVPSGGRLGDGPVFDWDDGDGADADGDRGS